MNLETYDLDAEEFKLLLQGKSDFLCQLMRQHLETLKAYQIPLKYLEDSKFFWNSFQEVLYAASDDARVIQKEKNPEAIKKRSYSFQDFKVEEV
jgi:hypothetical protein